MSQRVDASADRRLGELVAERDHLLASLDDLERERAAGDVDASDYETLRADYVARAARTLRAIESMRSATDSETAPGATAPHGPGVHGRMRRSRVLGRPRLRRGLGVAAACCLVGVVAAVAAGLATARQPGQSATGSVSVPAAAQIRRQLNEASVLGTAGDVRDAVALYSSVLKEAPGNAEALAYQGWLIRLTGRSARDAATVKAADAELAKAVAADPRYASARAFEGIALIEDAHDVAGALAQFRAFLADHPTRSLLDALGPSMAKTFADAGAALPAALRRFAPA